MWVQRTRAGAPKLTDILASQVSLGNLIGMMLSALNGRFVTMDGFQVNFLQNVLGKDEMQCRRPKS